MSVLVAAGLAGAATVVLMGGLPAPGGVRLAALVAGGSARRSPSPRDTVVVPALVVLALAVALWAGPLTAALAAGLAVAGFRGQAARRRGRVAAQERAGAAQACRVLAAELGAGRTPAEALAAAAEPASGPSAQALEGAAAAARLGGDVPAALLSGGGAGAVAPVLRALAACWEVCATSGSGLAAAVQRLEEGLQSDQERRRMLDAELAGPRATAGLLAVLPAAGLLMAAGLGADPLHVLLETAVGRVCLVAGLLLDGLGLLWTQRLVARVQPA